jgi:dolichol-phosphate mannosyltransferase
MTRTKPLISIIIPTYNERENIIGLIQEIQNEINYSKEIIIVDDASPDRTGQVIKLFIKKNPDYKIKLIERLQDHGLVQSINEGIKESSGDIISWMDADFSHPPKVLAQLIESILTRKSDVVFASRFIKGGNQKINNQVESRWVIIGSTIMNKILNHIYWNQITDFTSGFIVIRKNFLNNYQLQGNYGDYFINLVAYLKINHIKVKEIGYVCPPRKFGISKTAPTLKLFFIRTFQYLFTSISIFLPKN